MIKIMRKLSIAHPANDNLKRILLTNLYVMDATHKPIKRSPYLAPLSRDHHDTLLFVWKIRQGILLSVDPVRIGKFCRWYWDNILKLHFETEEKSFSKIFDRDNPFLLKMIDDHRAIEEKFKQDFESPAYPSIKRLAQLINYHVRFEERSVFAHIQEHFSEDVLKELLVSAGKSTKKFAPWVDEFWLQPSNCKINT